MHRKSLLQKNTFKAYTAILISLFTVKSFSLEQDACSQIKYKEINYDNSKDFQENFRKIQNKLHSIYNIRNVIQNKKYSNYQDRKLQHMCHTKLNNIEKKTINHIKEHKKQWINKANIANKSEEANLIKRWLKQDFDLKAKKNLIIEQQKYKKLMHETEYKINKKCNNNLDKNKFILFVSGQKNDFCREEAWLSYYFINNKEINNTKNNIFKYYKKFYKATSSKELIKKVIELNYLDKIEHINNIIDSYNKIPEIKPWNKYIFLKKNKDSFIIESFKAVDFIKQVMHDFDLSIKVIQEKKEYFEWQIWKQDNFLGELYVKNKDNFSAKVIKKSIYNKQPSLVILETPIYIDRYFKKKKLLQKITDALYNIRNINSNFTHNYKEPNDLSSLGYYWINEIYMEENRNKQTRLYEETKETILAWKSKNEIMMIENKDYLENKKLQKKIAFSYDYFTENLKYTKIWQNKLAKYIANNCKNKKDVFEYLFTRNTINLIKKLQNGLNKNIFIKNIINNKKAKC